MSQNRLHDFESELNRKLDGHELDVPDHIWSAIEAERHPVKKERWPVLLLLLLFVGLGGAGIWAYNNSYSADPDLATTNELSSASGESLSSTHSADQNQLSDDLSQHQDKGTIPQASGTENVKKAQKWTNQSLDLPGTQTISRDGSFSSEKEMPSSPAMNSGQTTSLSREQELSPSLLLQKRNKFSILSPLERNTDIADVEIAEKSLQCPIFSDKGGMTNISMEFGVGPALSFHQISADPAYTDFLSARLQREQPLVNYGAHVRLKKEWANNTTASVGFNLTSFSYQYKRADSNEVRRTIITIDTFYQGHDYTTSVDTLLLVEYGIQEHRSGMTHRVLSFPVSFGYKLEVDRLFLEPYLGATFNIFQEARWSEDMFSDLIEGPVEDVMAYRTNLGVMAHVGLTLGYELNNRWSIILQPEYHYSWNSITEPNRPLTENRNWININAGVKYKLWQTKTMR